MKRYILGRLVVLCLRHSAAFAMIAVALTSIPGFAAQEHVELHSPKEVLSASITVDESGKAWLSIDRGTEHVLLPSRLGFDSAWDDAFSIAATERTVSHSAWIPVYGERDHVYDNYEQLTMRLRRRDGRVMVVQLRAYDYGVALRYGGLQPMGQLIERTEFHFPAGSFGYEEHGTEGEYARKPISAIGPGCQTPLTVSLADGSYAAVLEAGNVNFPEMQVEAIENHPDTLMARLVGPGSLAAGAFTPWRLVMFAKNPGDLLEHNDIELNLNAPQRLRNVTWIHPGTAMREVSLSDDGARKLIDFAAAHRIAYIGFDDGWYGTVDYDTGNATHERRFDKMGKLAPPLHIQEVVHYAQQRGVGVWLYVDYRQAEKQRDILFPLYEHWGIAGVKIGFVRVGAQERTAWITETVRKAAEHHLMLDIHDSYRTTGYTRTYPNLLTVEGIRGNEHFPTSEHDATVPFTRYLAGSADYTICYFDKRLKNTHAHQLAMSVMSYSPLQWIFWYDQPSDAHNEPELTWFEHLPTVWDETRVPLGEIGRYAVLARRKGRAWFVGAIGDSQGQTLHLPMNFLRRGLTYDATLYTDDPNIATDTHIGITHRRVTVDDVLDLPLRARGGEAIYLEPVADTSGR